jgi:hypothetical protein
MNPYYAEVEETHPLDLVIQLNNEGVSHVLRDNEDKQAVSCFVKALRILKKMIIEEPEGNEKDGISPSQIILHSSTHPLPQFEESEFFLFNSIISFKQRCEQEAPPRPADKHVYCAAIILNIAIVYHRQAILGEKDAIIKAEKFYNMVIKIAGNSGRHEGTEVMLKLAAVNNLSGMCFEKGDFESSEEGFQTLAWLISSTQVDRSCLLNSEVVEGMLLNALMVNRQAAAPAA